MGAGRKSVRCSILLDNPSDTISVFDTLLAQLQIIGSACAQQQPQQLFPIGVHIVIAVLAFILLAIGFLWSLYTVFQNPTSTPAQRDIAKLFIGFFIGIGSRYFA